MPVSHFTESQAAPLARNRGVFVTTVQLDVLHRVAQ